MKHQRLLAFGIIAALGGFGPSPAAQGTAPKNILPNPSFETAAANGLPADWRSQSWQAKGEFALDETVAHSGRRGLRIASSSGADASVQAVVAVRPFAKYRLSGWIKTRDLEAGRSRGALINLHGLDIRTPALEGTRDWTRVETVFDSGAEDAVSVNCLFGGWGLAKGTAWFDDVSLELLSARPLNPRASIDATAAKTPISKYIYGQFIEHLGRCIYQGIWAEMLEDRKFFHPVGDSKSPWRTVGEARAVRMNPILTYAGVPAPEIRLRGDGGPGGLVQEALAVAAGAGYVGRIVLACDPGAAPVEVSLVWGRAPSDRQTVLIKDAGTGYRTFPLAFRAGASSDAARLEILSRGRESFRVGAVSLMPADNVEGFRPDVLKLLRELDAPVYRWPGGNFVSGYDWRDGLGERDRRPPRKNPAWQGVEHNDVGLHEFLRLCELIRTDPYISVNSGQGDEAMAADEVEYVNGGPETPMGARRAADGRSAPWKVRFWSIGNEMYGDWQLGHMPLADYVRKHNRFAAAMRKKDPSIELIGVGAVGAWSETMLAECAKSMEYLSEHFYVGTKPGLLSHVSQAPREVKRIADAHREYRATIPALKDKAIPVALDEWNYWYGPYVYGELGTQYFLKDALGIAAGLHELFRNTDVYFMANYAQTVNVIGAIKTSKTAAVLDTTGEVLKLYRARFGTVPVAVAGAPEPLDVAAAWTAGRTALTVAVVNPTREAARLELRFKGFRPPASARLFLITGPEETACNVPGRPPAVTVVERAGAPFGSSITVPPMSVSLYELK